MRKRPDIVLIDPAASRIVHRNRIFGESCVVPIPASGSGSRGGTSRVFGVLENGESRVGVMMLGFSARRTRGAAQNRGSTRHSTLIDKARVVESTYEMPSPPESTVAILRADDGLTTHEAKSAAEALVESLGVNSSSAFREGRSIDWHIDNAYYSADVWLEYVDKVDELRRVPAVVALVRMEVVRTC